MTTEDMTFSTKPFDWEDFISVIRSSPTPDDFLSPLDRNTIEVKRDLFHDINE
jgi:hypothetical protein